MAKERFGLIGTVHLMMENGGKFLFLRRSNTGYMDGHFSLVAGHIDGGEPATEAAVREAEEEVGVKILPKDLELVHLMHRNENDSRIDFFFLVREWEGKPRNCEPEKHDCLKWLSPDELPEKTVPYIREALSRLGEGRKFSELYW